MFSKLISTWIAIVIALSGVLSSTAYANNVKHIDNPDLVKAVDNRPAENKARDKFRHPVETLSFFKITPGMSVVEVLPGGGWYSEILANYLGPKGALYGLNYNDDMWARFGFFGDDVIAQRIASTKQFSDKVKSFTANNIKSDGYTFATVPKTLNKSIDRVLFIRALHNLRRFEGEAGTLTEALAVTHRVLKDDGYVGVVQHQLMESAPEKGADGTRGYLKLTTVTKAFEQAGFVLVASSDINKNDKDRPSDEDIVWRLPPTYFGAGEDAAKRKKVDKIGESKSHDSFI